MSQNITMCRRTQNPFKRLRWNVFAQTVYTLKSLTEYVKKPHLTCLKGFEYASAAKQGRCKVCEKTFWRRYVKYINLRDVCFEIFQWYYLAFERLFIFDCFLKSSVLDVWQNFEFPCKPRLAEELLLRCLARSWLHLCINLINIFHHISSQTVLSTVKSSWP